MSWVLLLLAVALLAIAVALALSRRAELSRLSGALAERARARVKGSHKPRLQHPVVDLSRCLGCGACVRACPEEGVLELIHGQAMVVHGARCVGHAQCAQVCPTGAIAVAIADLAERHDIPALADNFEVPDVPGLFLAGEVTGYALIRTAVAHGVAVADEVARRVEMSGTSTRPSVYDLCVVGAGPAGLACALRAREKNLRFVVLEQDELGGTVAKYPRRKLVMSQPLDLPLHGRIEARTMQKEELMELWERVARDAELPLRTGVHVLGTERIEGGALRVRTEGGPVDAHHVCLALGRRGTPIKLGVPGEELTKVAYSLLDAASYQDRRVLVVGGGDSAVEAALGLAEQPGNTVTISYRRADFSRLKARNEARLEEARRAKRLSVITQSVVTCITPELVELALERGGAVEPLMLENDDVFVFAGGTPPFPMLEQAGVSFDPKDREAPRGFVEQGAGIVHALGFALLAALATLAWVGTHASYYGLPLEARPQAPGHDWLRPSGAIGLASGIASLCVVVANLAYLARRASWRLFRWASLQAWMTSHVATGVLALFLALVHSAMAPRDTVGGHAFLALTALVVSGAIGRYFYAYVPRAANGRELALEEARARLTALSAEWDRERGEVGAGVRAEIDTLASGERWSGSFARRVVALARTRRRLRTALRRLRREGADAGLANDQIETLVSLAARAERAAFAAARFEELRGLLATWRHVHRFAAAILVIMIAVHVVVAVRFGGLFT